jgi:hypothetical protein
MNIMKTFFKVKNLLKSTIYLKNRLSLNGAVQRDSASVCNTCTAPFSDRL